MRAVGYLSRREHARDELARKLAPHAEDADEVERVLDALEKEGWLSTERFAQSLVHRRASRQGAARIVQELRQHGVDDTQVSELREQLRATEYPRALEVWQKRFGAKPEDREMCIRDRPRPRSPCRFPCGPVSPRSWPACWSSAWACAAEARRAQYPGGRCEAAFFMGARNASGKKAARLNRGRAGTGAHNTAS